MEWEGGERNRERSALALARTMELKCKKMQRAKCKQSSLVRQVSVRERNTSCCGISKKRTELETLTPYNQNSSFFNRKSAVCLPPSRPKQPSTTHPSSTFVSVASNPSVPCPATASKSVSVCDQRPTFVKTTFRSTWTTTRFA